MTTPSTAALSPLHSFFASNFPLLQQQHQQEEGEGVVPLAIVSDNAKGLCPKGSLSERRRLYEARQARLGDLFVSPPPPPATMGISRWESEWPESPVSSGSPSIPAKRESITASPCSSSSSCAVVGIPKIPQRRTSVEDDLALPDSDDEEDEQLESEFEECLKRVEAATAEDDQTVSTEASTTEHTRDSADFPLLPPRRRTSCLEWLEQIEANESAEKLATEEKLSLSTTRLTRRSAAILSPQMNENPNSLDNHVRAIRAHHITVATANTDSIKKKDSMDKNRKSSTKHAPRRPRRMKSIDGLEDSMTSVTSSVDDRGHDSDSSLRLSSITHSIKSVLDQMKEAEDKHSHNSSSKMSSSEQIILKDAVKGVVGALSVRRNSQGSTSEASSASSACCKPISKPLVTAL